MLEALGRLGVPCEQQRSPNDYLVRGVGGPFPMKTGDLFLGNAGTAFRPLTAATALSSGEYHLHGVPRMHERPIGDLVDALRALGADISYLGNEGFPPLSIRPGNIKGGGRVAVKGNASSQFLTALLMALPLTGQRMTVEVVGDLISKPYIEITLKLMARFGVMVERDGWKAFTVPAGAAYVSPGEVFVEGDASSASYFLAAGAIAGGPVRVEGVGRDSIQGDVRFAEALANMGARIEMGPNWIEARPPISGRLTAFDADFNHIPDAAMTLAVAALFADGPCTLRNIASWRVKETDRIAAMATELRKLGATVEEGEDWLRITPPRPASLTAHAEIATYDDHRMAMCFSLVSLAGVPVRILDPKCVNKTFPEYFQKFSEITMPIHVPHPATLPAVVAIDGPSASGKGTVAARVASALGFHYLDSGSLYRLTALAAKNAGVAWDDEAGLAAIAAGLPVVFEGGETLLAGTAVGDAIRTEEISVGASKVAALPAVRAALLQRQRDFRQAPGLVAEGRDMGSVVFPDAQLKVFLTASAEARADRRYKQLIEKGLPANMADLLQDLRDRDARDSARSVAPLQKCAEAELLDTTSLGIEESVAAILAWAGKAL
jgi:3-phosphoshikimate 1-carboxyvinyltransferase